MNNKMRYIYKKRKVKQWDTYYIRFNAKTVDY